MATQATYAAALGVGGSSIRPDPINFPPIAPPFDPNDGSGQVHTTLPPEQIIPPHFVDPTFMRADFNGVCLDGEYTPKTGPEVIAAGGFTFTSGRWKGLRVPFLQGSNSTPPPMLMTPMAILYPREVQDAILTEHALRGYDDFIIAPDGWGFSENVFTPTPANILAWCEYVRSWGFRVVLWQGNAHAGLDTMFRTLFDAGVMSFYIHGKEVDSSFTSEAYEASLQEMDRFISGRLPIGVHFTATGAPRYMGYPIGFPRDTFLSNWAPYDGRVHLCQQLDVEASAGLQGASMYYARLHVNCGIGDAASGPGAPNSRVIAFETMAYAQLYGKCTEGYGCLRDWELLCGTRNHACARPVSGSGNGCRYPDGRPL